MRFNIPEPDEIAAAYEDLECYVIRWPNTMHWKALLSGVLYLLTRGRSWDENTGSILDIQAAAQHLFRINIPLNKCEGGRDDTPDNEADFARLLGAGGGYYEEYDMWAVTDVTIENGKLVLHYGPCCQKTVDGGLYASGSAGETTFNPWEGQTDSEGQPLQGWGCGKATAMIDTVWGVGDYIASNFPFPPTILRGLKGIYPDISFNSMYVTTALLEWAKVTVIDAMDPLELLLPGGVTSHIWDQEKVFDERRKEKWICELAKTLPNDLTRPTEADIQRMRNLANAIYPFGVSPFWEAVILAIGQGDLRDIGLLGATTQYDCGCPELHGSQDPLQEPDEYGWYWSAALEPINIVSTSQSGWSRDCRLHTLDHDAFGYMLSIARPGAAPELKIMGGENTDCEGQGGALSGNTSGNLQANPLYASGDVSLLNDLLGAGTWTKIGSDAWRAYSNDPAVVVSGLEQGDTLVEAWELGYNVAGSAIITNFRWLHNVNSPSHGS